MDIFRAQEDFEYMRHCLREARVGRGVALHSYVLMSNHIHLLVTAEDDTGVSRFVQSAAVRYVARFNRKYQRTGTLWEGRFFSAVVTTDHYLMACHRYIDENPIRAGLASCAADYPWSSHRHHAYGVELDECRKTSGFASFDEFFTRELRELVMLVRDPDTELVARLTVMQRDYAGSALRAVPCPAQ